MQSASKKQKHVNVYGDIVVLDWVIVHPMSLSRRQSMSKWQCKAMDRAHGRTQLPDLKWWLHCLFVGPKDQRKFKFSLQWLQMCCRRHRQQMIAQGVSSRLIRMRYLAHSKTRSMLWRENCVHYCLLITILICINHTKCWCLRCHADHMSKHA